MDNATPSLDAEPMVQEMRVEVGPAKIETTEPYEAVLVVAGMIILGLAFLVMRRK